jgi:DnaK suppressor protein
MDRLQDGDYGLCAACGGDIAVKRLVTRPTAIHCIDCRSSETMLRPVGGW